MANELFNYLSRRVQQPGFIPNRSFHVPGPVITISREVGCSGLEMAGALAEKLNKTGTSAKWKVLSKEIFQQSAQELNLEPHKVARIFRQTDRNAFDEILNAFGEKRFKSDKKIRKTVCDVIRGFAEDGFCIIVGRGSNYLASGIQHSLHIRLVAPLEYRIGVIMAKNHLNAEEAAAFITRVEKERLAYRHAVQGHASVKPEIFDLTFNRETFTTGMITDMILCAVREKHILDDYAKTGQ